MAARLKMRNGAFAAGSDRRVLVERFEEVLRTAIERHRARRSA